MDEGCFASVLVLLHEMHETPYLRNYSACWLEYSVEVVEEVAILIMNIVIPRSLCIY